MMTESVSRIRVLIAEDDDNARSLLSDLLGTLGHTIVAEVSTGREAFERAKATGDKSQMAALDFAYRREQLYFEILLDIREAMERRA